MSSIVNRFIYPTVIYVEKIESELIFVNQNQNSYESGIERLPKVFQAFVDKGEELVQA